MKVEVPVGSWVKITSTEKSETKVLLTVSKDVVVEVETLPPPSTGKKVIRWLRLETTE